jgi:hypothetical protein
MARDKHGRGSYSKLTPDIMPVDLMTRLRPGYFENAALDALYGGQAGNDGYYDAPPSLHSRQSSVTAVSRTSSTEMASSPASVTTGPPSSGSRIGRPPQWTVSRSRKLARLYLYSTLPVEKILKVLEGDNFHPRWEPGRTSQTAKQPLIGQPGRTQPRRPSTRCSTMTLATSGPSPGLR